MNSTILGKTGNGRKITGWVTPKRFVARDGKLFMRSTVNMVIWNLDGTKKKVSIDRVLRVKNINGVAAVTHNARTAPTQLARASCDVLHLNLAPLDLDLLGLQVHLDRVVLDIVAKSGAGNLVGNLLCAVTGLLDGGLSGLLARVGGLLNQVLGALNLLQ